MPPDALCPPLSKLVGVHKHSFIGKLPDITQAVGNDNVQKEDSFITNMLGRYET